MSCTTVSVEQLVFYFPEQRYARNFFKSIDPPLKSGELPQQIFDFVIQSYVHVHKPLVCRSLKLTFFRRKRVNPVIQNVIFRKTLF